MRDRIIDNINNRFGVYFDLLNEVSDENLALKTAELKNKSLKEHLWCLVGARESYSHAIKAGEWAGFNCSLVEMDKEDISQALTRSAQAFNVITNEVEQWDETRDQYLVDLLEHETMHEGQIIRHLYALELHIPASWKWA